VSSSVPFVGFTVGGVPLAVEAVKVRGVARAEGIFAVPFSRPCVRGVIIRQGRLVPVLDLTHLPSLWNEVPPSGGEQLVVFGVRELEAAVLADMAETFMAEPEPAVLSGEAASRPLSRLREGILSGSVAAGGRRYGILGVEAALAAAGVPAS